MSDHVDQVAETPVFTEDNGGLLWTSDFWRAMRWADSVKAARIAIGFASAIFDTPVTPWPPRQVRARGS